MSQSLTTIKMDDSLGHIQKLFNHSPFHHLLVVSNQKLVGIISDRDLFKALSPNLGTGHENTKDLACLRKKAHQIMARHPITLLASDKVQEAIKIFNAHSISCIPITDKEGKPIGMLSWRDILRCIEK